MLVDEVPHVAGLRACLTIMWDFVDQHGVDRRYPLALGGVVGAVVTHAQVRQGQQAQHSSHSRLSLASGKGVQTGCGSNTEAVLCNLSFRQAKMNSYTSPKVKIKLTELPQKFFIKARTAIPQPHIPNSFTSQGDQLAAIKACAVFTVNNGAITATCTKRVLEDHCSWSVLEDKLSWFNLNCNQLLICLMPTTVQSKLLSLKD
ncbi:MAG: hypothetical protein FRX49_02892 [Trebouxia sp. A1-2]|nr:MAG: hypothetical protein FRX49_02892 [Trebouxia sp. A1-2]